MEVILLVALNARLQEPQEAREEDLVTALADSGVVNMTAQFMSRRRYRGAGRWMCQMMREVRQVTGRGDCILSFYRHIFSNAGVRWARLLTDNCMLLAVIQGK